MGPRNSQRHVKKNASDFGSPLIQFFLVSVKKGTRQRVKIIQPTQQSPNAVSDPHKWASTTPPTISPPLLSPPVNSNFLASPPPTRVSTRPRTVTNYQEVFLHLYENDA